MESAEEWLARQLRSPHEVGRRSAARRLAELGTPTSVEALIALADSDAALDDQLMAIEYLGETRAPRARAFLETLLEEEVAAVEQTYSWTAGEDVRCVACLDEEHFCPNARGALRYALTYVVQLYEKTPRRGVRQRPEADIQADRDNLRKSREAFLVVREALEKLG